MTTTSYWPPVNPADRFDTAFENYLLDLPWEEKRAFIKRLRKTAPQEAEATLQRFLGAAVASYLYGYRDSPLHGRVDPDLEMRLLQAKIALEQEFLETYSSTKGVPVVDGQKETADYLERFVTSNPGHDHPLFAYLENRAGRREILAFLLNEVSRNQVFDDEMALLTFGLQGTLKATAAENLWDEVGHGDLHKFHTWWLQRLLDSEGAWNALAEYQARSERWRFLFTSNVMNLFLTRPGLKYAAYGATTTYESWVPHHFTRLLNGMRRVGITHPDTRLYFTTHVRIDVRHGQELIQAIGSQTPELSAEDCRQIIFGALTAVNAACRQYDLTLEYLRALGESYEYPL